MSPPAKPTAARLREIYEILREDHGTLDWWPGRTRFEIVVGAILAQNTAWKNVEKAIASLRSRRLLSVSAMSRVSEEDLAEAIRASGYYRQKARKLKLFLAWLAQRHGGSLARADRVSTDEMREELLGIWGIGPETADSILLYAFGRPVFVVDAYTHRLLVRHGLRGLAGYEETRGFLEAHIPASVELYNDFHAQIVWVGHRYCRATPRCEGCPLRGLLPGGRPAPECDGPRRMR
jgi:endonuclease III related protein